MTFCFKGYTELMGAFNELGLLDTKERNDIKSGMSWAELLKSVLGKEDVEFGNKASWRNAITLKLKPHQNDSNGRIERVINALEWLDSFNLLSYFKSIIYLPANFFYYRLDMFSPYRPAGCGLSVLDSFCELLQTKLVYGPHERDMVIMHHEFGIKWSDSGAKVIYNIYGCIYSQ